MALQRRSLGPCISARAAAFSGVLYTFLSLGCVSMISLLVHIPSRPPPLFLVVETQTGRVSSLWILRGGRSFRNRRAWEAQSAARDMQPHRASTRPPVGPAADSCVRHELKKATGRCCGHDLGPGARSVQQLEQKLFLQDTLFQQLLVPALRSHPPGNNLQGAIPS